MEAIVCTKCGGLIDGESKTTAINKCKCPPPETKLTGWICPVCGAGLSPFMSYCPCHKTFTMGDFPYPEVLHFEHKPNIKFE